MLDTFPRHTTQAQAVAIFNAGTVAAAIALNNAAATVTLPSAWAHSHWHRKSGDARDKTVKTVNDHFGSRIVEDNFGVKTWRREVGFATFES